MSYYHYTNKSGYLAIKDSGYIRESTNPDAGDDARYGRGVYLTTLDPSVGKEKIIETCWGRGVVDISRVEYVFRIELPSNTVQQTQKEKVYLHEGDLYLKHYDWKGEKC